MVGIQEGRWVNRRVNRRENRRENKIIDKRVGRSTPVRKKNKLMT